jgi:hypothetical protein
MNLQNWINLGRAHWKEHLPNRYRELKAAGTLEKALTDAAEQTYREVDQLEQSGFQPDEAWQMVRETYLLLPPENAPRAGTGEKPMTHQLADAARNGSRTLDVT